MRIFIYKTFIIIVAIFFLYQLTIGYTIHSFQKKLYSSFDKESAEKIKDKIREEIKSGLKKDKILNVEDAILIKKFFEKVNSEIKNLE
tara:strand:+ start:20 stop:283 length:264 start_codon:yes stop_codon:yes gene_type:complete